MQHSLHVTLMPNTTPNPALNRSAEQRRCSVPAALRAPAPG